MNLTHLTQDVSPDAYATFADERSEARRQDAYEEYTKLNRNRRRELGEDPPGVLDEDEWMQTHPAGFLEYEEAFGPNGLYGRWLRKKDVVVKVGDTIFLHGGLNPEHVDESLDDINDDIRGEIKKFDRYWDRLIDRDVIAPSFTFYDALNAAKVDLESWLARMKGTSRVQSPVFARDQQHVEMLIELLQAGNWLMLHEDGPLWFRGYASWTAEEGEPLVQEVLKRYDARRIVVGHTVSGSHRILRRFDGRIFLIDTGMLSQVYQGGQPSALEIVGDRVTAVYVGEREVLD